MEKDKKLCSGCHDDFYNKNEKGGCWMFASAEVVERQRVGTWQPPPYKWNPETTLSCYHGEGCSMLPKDDCRIEYNQSRKPPGAA